LKGPEVNQLDAGQSFQTPTLRPHSSFRRDYAGPVDAASADGRSASLVTPFWIGPESVKLTHEQQRTLW
jgi:hypothetical protein